MNSFSIIDSLRAGWNRVIANLGFFLAFSVILLILSSLPALFETLEGEMLSVFATISYIISFILGIWAVRVSLDAIDRKPLGFREILPTWEVAWKFFLSSLLVAIAAGGPFIILMMFVGFASFGATVMGSGTLIAGFSGGMAIALLITLLLFLAGIYLNIRFCLATYAVVDKKLGPVDSLRKSWVLTKGSFWKLFGFSIVSIFIMFLGLLALGVGILIALPIIMVAFAYVYRALDGGFVPTPSGTTTAVSGDSVPTPPSPSDEL